MKKKKQFTMDFVKKKGGNATECTKTGQEREQHRAAFLEGSIIINAMFCCGSMKEQT